MMITLKTATLQSAAHNDDYDDNDNNSNSNSNSNSEVDDFTLSGDLDTVEKDVVVIEQSAAETGLPLNRTKREIIMEDFSKISMRDTFKDFIRVGREEMTLLGSPDSEGKAHHAEDRWAPEGDEAAGIATFSRRTGPSEEQSGNTLSAQNVQLQRQAITGWL